VGYHSRLLADLLKCKQGRFTGITGLSGQKQLLFTSAFYRKLSVITLNDLRILKL